MMPLASLIATRFFLPTILSATVSPAAVPPGTTLRVTYRWQATPIDRDASVFVHIVDGTGKIVLQDDHLPPSATSRWSGTIDYTRKLDLPKGLADGAYRIVAGLYVAATEGQGWRNLALNAGKGVSSSGDAAYTIGSFRVDRAAPPPPLDSAKRPTLSLKGYRITFRDEFDDLSVSPRGPAGMGGTRWIAHKPDGGDFGDAPFADPEAGFPFSVGGGLLRIEARKTANVWRAGLLSSVDPQGRGFAQRYGYFEMRARFPQGAGTWPAFWMLRQDHLVDPKVPDVEIDVVEAYGHAPDLVHTTLHLWKPNDHRAWGDSLRVADTTAGFHRYGLLWNAKTIVWYFDGVELFRRPTPPEANAPMYLLIDLALGGGWPIAQTPNPSVMLVDYVRAYAKE